MIYSQHCVIGKFTDPGALPVSGRPHRMPESLLPKAVQNISLRSYRLSQPVEATHLQILLLKETPRVTLTDL